MPVIDPESNLQWYEKPPFNLVEEPELRPNMPLSIEDPRAHVKLFVRARHSATLNDFFARAQLHFGNIYAILGDYGSGKTSTVAYVRHQLMLKGLHVLNIDLNWVLRRIRDPYQIRSWIFKELQKQLMDAFTATTGLSAHRLLLDGEKLDEERVIQIFDEFSDTYDGFTILIDELHRAEDYHDQKHILDCLKGMQTFFTKLCRHKIAIFVAAPSSWITNFDQDQYGGIFTELVELPIWRAEDAYDLVSTRLKDKAKDPRRFRSPLTHETLKAIRLLPDIRHAPPKTPRDWLKHVWRLCREIPEGVLRITPQIVRQALSRVDPKTINEFLNYARQEHPSAFKKIRAILQKERGEAEALLDLVARMYPEVELSRPEPDAEDSRKVGIPLAELRVLLNGLRDLDILQKGTGYRGPVKAAGRTLEPAKGKPVYRIAEDMKELFTGIDEENQLGPMQYLPRFIESEVELAEVEQREDLNQRMLEQIRTIIEKVRIPRARNHLKYALDYYTRFGKVTSSSIGVHDLNAGFEAIHNIVEAFFIEKTRDEHHMPDFYRDLTFLQTSQILEKRLAELTSRLHRDWQDIKSTARTDTKEFLREAYEKIPQIAGKLVDSLHTWVLQGRDERQ